MSKKHSQETVDKIIELKLRGVSSRKIAEEVFGKKTAKSTVNSIWNRVEKNLEQDTPKDESSNLTDEQLDTLCENPDWSVSNLAKRLRSAQRTNNQLRKVQREVFDGGEDAVPSLSDLLKNLEGVVGGSAPKVLDYRPSVKATPSTLEVLISDLQIGKLTRHYNTKTCLEAVEQYGLDLMEEIASKEGKFKLERVVLELLGDLVEDNEKHGVQSAISTDCGMSEQIQLATTALWDFVLLPLANLGVEVEVVCVVGNHGASTRKGMGTFKEGKYSFDYIIFKTLEKFCEIAKLSNVSFNIPEGIFAHTEIYGNHVILEHGYTNNTSEKGMVDQMRKRGAQLKVHPTYWRQGDKHHSICYGQGEQICNSAWFGADTEGLEYSGILGFSAIPSQTIVWHTEEQSVGKSTVKDIVNIQVFQEG
jgi:hypothetical protein